MKIIGLKIVLSDRGWELLEKSNWTENELIDELSTASKDYLVDIIESIEDDLIDVPRTKKTEPENVKAL